MREGRSEEEDLVISRTEHSQPASSPALLHHHLPVPITTVLKLINSSRPFYAIFIRISDFPSSIFPPPFIFHPSKQTPQNAEPNVAALKRSSLCTRKKSGEPKVAGRFCQGQSTQKFPRLGVNHYQS